MGAGAAYGLLFVLLGQFLLSSVYGVRITHTNAKVDQAAASFDLDAVRLVAGVPVYNTHLASEDDRASSFLQSVKGETVEGRNHWLIIFRAGVLDDHLNTICEANVNCTRRGHSNGVPFAEIRGSEEDLAKFLEGVKGDVDFVEPDLPVTTVPEVQEGGDEQDNATNAPKRRGRVSDVWNLDRVGSRFRRTTGKGVHVYVLDTGVRTTHEEFGGRAVPTLEVVSDVVVECKGDQSCAADERGHGTHCAGIVAGSEHGVAPEATVHAVKVLRSDGVGASSWVLNAVDWIVRNGERPAVISMSLVGKGTSMSYKVAVERAVQAGITVVVAAGNDGVDACDAQATVEPYAISVGAVDANDRLAPYSNFGSCVDIFAPGTRIVSLGHTSDHDTAMLSGTSMACPHVAGAAAALLEAEPSLGPTEVKERLLSTARVNTIAGDLHGAKNRLLSLLTCPAFAEEPAPDTNGNCKCYASSCQNGGAAGCPADGSNALSLDYFSAGCHDCYCQATNPTSNSTRPAVSTTRPPQSTCPPDNAAFRDAHGFACAKWQGHDCGKSGWFYWYKNWELQSVQRNCPQVCHACEAKVAEASSTTGVCTDDGGYRDVHGYACQAWEHASCNKGGWFHHYSDAELKQVRAKCHRACGLCSANPNHEFVRAASACTDDRNFHDVHDFDCASWAGHDCTKNGWFHWYTKEELRKVRERCRVSCKSC